MSPQKPATSITERNWKSEFSEGFWAGLPVAITASFFGMLFGAAAIKAGLQFWEAILASATIYAGASQFVMLELYGYQAPAWSILLAVLAVNFRHILYSASLGRKMTEFSSLQKFIAFFFMVDPQYGVSEQRIEKTGSLSRAFYFGYVGAMYPLWMCASVTGAWFGSLLGEPAKYGLDMLLPIYFLTLVMGFRTRPNWLIVVLASGISSALIYKFWGPPWHMSLGAAVGILLAAIIGKPSGAVADVMDTGTPAKGEKP